jgi:Ni/Co efflux regulator RcnB
MKKVMIAALALTMFGGAAFAQNAKPKPMTQQESKQENKDEHAKHHSKKKVKKDKKVAAVQTKAETVK